MAPMREDDSPLAKRHDGRMSLYRGPIIDAHIHLWDLSLDRHPWLRAESALGDVSALRQSYLVKTFWADAANQNIVAAVYVEAGWDRARDPLEEIEWLEGLDKSSGVAARYIGYADLTAPDVDAVLARLAAHRRCVGVRQMLSWSPAEPDRNFAPRPHIADEPGFRHGVARLAAHDLLLELMLYPYQAEEVARLAQDFPEQIFVVNHCGSPIERDSEGMARWREGLRRLGARPNVMLKISALTAYDPAPTPESLAAVVRHCLECFETERALFGSDFPVGKLWTSYDSIFDGFKAMASGLSDAEQAALFHDNARRLYRLG
jgi:predicted TIM-barrel fold metal-dependent hydrolase